MFTQREKVLLAMVGSVLLHLGVLLTWALLVQWIPGAQAISTPPAEPEPLKVELLEEEKPLPPEPTPEPSMKPFVDTADLVEGTPPPGSVKFESGKNTAAASEEPAAGDQSLPTQRGKKLTTFAFSTQAYTPGQETVAQAAATPAPETAPAPPKPTKPRPTPPPTATPAATPEQIAAAEQLAMLTPASIPVTPSAESNPYDPSFRPPDDLTEPPMPTPDPLARHPAKPLRPFEEKSEINGGISRSGAASVDSVATPAGRYQSTVVTAIKSCWNKYIHQRSDVVSLGMVKLRVIVDRDGRLRSPRILSNTGNVALESVSLAAIMSVRIPPMPDDAAAQFDGGQFQLNLELTCE